MKRILFFGSMIGLLILITAGCVTPPPPEEIPEPVVIEEPPPPPAVPEVKEIPEIIEPEIETLALVFTSGLYGMDHFGIPRAGAQYKDYQDRYDSALIDRGGSFSGAEFADTDEGEGVLTLMNLLSYDGMALGVLDLAHDTLRLSELIGMASFPVFSTNLRGIDGIESTLLINAGDYTIGILSVVDPQAYANLHPTITHNTEALDPFEILEEQTKHLSEAGADLIILLSEIDVLSWNYSEEQLSAAEALLKDITLILQREPAELQQISQSWIYGTDDPLFSILLYFEDGTFDYVEKTIYTAEDIEPESYLADVEASIEEDHRRIAEQAKSYYESGEVNQKDEYGLSPLMNALQYDETPPVVGVLLREGADVEARDDFGMTPLMYSAWLNTNPRVTALLLRSGASMTDQDDEGWTPLMRAVLNDNPQVMKMIIEGDADVDAENQEGWTALMFAAGFGDDLENIRILLDAGAEVNKQNDEGMTPLMYAAGFNSNPELIDLLLEAGADPDIMDDFGSTAVDYAQQNRDIRNTDVMQRLLEASSQQR